MDWVNLLQTLGVSTVSCVALAKFTARQIERDQERAEKRETKLVKRVEDLENEFRDVLIPLVQKTQEIISENTVAMERATVAFGIGKETRNKIQAIKES